MAENVDTTVRVADQAGQDTGPSRNVTRPGESPADAPGRGQRFLSEERGPGWTAWTVAAGAVDDDELGGRLVVVVGVVDDLMDAGDDTALAVAPGVGDLDLAGQGVIGV
jgi:hypothetical protein